MQKNSKWREWSGIALLAAGVAGTLLPVIPGFALIAAGVAVLGPDHFIVRRSRRWLEKKGVLKPLDTKPTTQNPVEPCAGPPTGVGSKQEASHP